MKHTYSFFTNEQECIKVILDLHNGGKEIELDPMYNKGMFYKALIKKPPLRYDLNAESKNYDAIQGDAASLPLPDNSVGCMILDRPFMFGTHGQTKNSVMNKRYTMFDTSQRAFWSSVTGTPLKMPLSPQRISPAWLLARCPSCGTST